MLPAHDHAGGDEILHYVQDDERAHPLTTDVDRTLLVDDQVRGGVEREDFGGSH
jgi:hypothetical protein